MDEEQKRDGHVCLKRGASLAEMKAKTKEEKEKIAPFSFEKSLKPLKKCVNLKPDTSMVEINSKGKKVAPFNYQD
eukprot:CAMPEP_0184542976 /NCGR_PEP_ID=MMETSP0199_2-20130426/2574_1 /TAXON_ID=1112570 /ORGANISM="Thraustochytrium sp., Strain LLF1b" /LENGTH=74 /DNA_ID=CAMNT_0026936941 /DNA_START=357 /DNA_END=581 /DNA_ORIENTATION=+